MPEILFANEKVLVINKPAGLIAHSDGRTVEPSLAEWLIEQYPALREVGEPWVSPQGEKVPTGGLVHRLDRTTSGIILAAKDADTYAYLKNEFKVRRVEKKYWAIVQGLLADEMGTVSAEIVRTEVAPKRWAARERDLSHPRTAITDWKVLRQFAYKGAPVSLLEVRPRTGRTRQIRVHLAHLGYPIVGDTHYGASILPGIARPMLHAWSLAVELEGEMKQWFAPAPEDFQSVFGE